MKKRLQREIEADSDADNDDIRSISQCDPKISPVKKPLKRSRKDKFLDGDSSDENDTASAYASNTRASSVLNPKGSEVFSSDSLTKALSNPSSNATAGPRNHYSHSSTTSAIATNATKRDAAPALLAPVASKMPADDFDVGDYRPPFTNDFTRSNVDIVLGNDKVQHFTYKINNYVARYLIDHQVYGVKWLFSKYATNDSAILGDDMGMGKTVQMAAFLNVIFMKSGTIHDKFVAHFKRNGTLTDILNQIQSNPVSRDLSSTLSSYSTTLLSLLQSMHSTYRHYAACKPVLVICPKSLVDNWARELKLWGYFMVDVLSNQSDSDHTADILRRARDRRSEIVLVSYSQIDRFVEELGSIHWDVIVFDEGHKLKNEQSKSYKDIMRIKHCACRLLLTGTPVQNDLRELWALLNLIYNGRFVSKAEFIKTIEKPMKRGMSSKANKQMVQQAKKANAELRSLLEECLLQRNKTMLQGDHALKGKDEIIVFCDLSPLQQRMYEQCLACPDFDNVRRHATLCPCQSGLVRSRCCLEYRIPLCRPASSSSSSTAATATATATVTATASTTTAASASATATGASALSLNIDPRAILWRQFHPNNRPCDESLVPVDPTSSKSDGTTSTTTTKGRIVCPLCLLLPCLNKLGKIACHPALLQADPLSLDTRKQALAAEFVRNAFDSSVITALGGVTRSTRFMTMKSTQDSGKMKTLLEMLRFFMQRQEKTLIFSLSTQVLDLLAALIKSEGWRHLRLDGQTPVKKRQQLVDEFNASSSSSSSSSSSMTGPVYLFLISSRAGGLGLNLNTASKVIIFDVDWNPVVDMQSQDRAYRIGQKDHVTVYRLVAKGTVEELAYMRQLYKQQLQQVVLGDPNASAAAAAAATTTNTTAATATGEAHGGNNFKRGPFEGVAGESTMRGELFGVENLFQFSKGSILQALRARFRTSRRDARRRSASQSNEGGRAMADSSSSSSAAAAAAASATGATPSNVAHEANTTAFEVTRVMAAVDNGEVDLRDRSMDKREVLSLLATVAPSSLSSLPTSTADTDSAPSVTAESMSTANASLDIAVPEDNHAYAVLQSIGIDLRDARHNADLLKSHGDDGPSNVKTAGLNNSTRVRAQETSDAADADDASGASPRDSDESVGGDGDANGDSSATEDVSESDDDDEDGDDDDDVIPRRASRVLPKSQAASAAVVVTVDDDDDEDGDAFFHRPVTPGLKRRHSLLLHSGIDRAATSTIVLHDAAAIVPPAREQAKERSPSIATSATVTPAAKNKRRVSWSDSEDEINTTLSSAAAARPSRGRGKKPSTAIAVTAPGSSSEALKPQQGTSKTPDTIRSLPVPSVVTSVAKPSATVSMSTPLAKSSLPLSGVTPNASLSTVSTAIASTVLPPTPITTPQPAATETTATVTSRIIPGAKKPAVSKLYIPKYTKKT